MKENINIVRSSVESFCRDALWMNVVWEEKPGLNGYQKSMRYKDEIIICYDIDSEYSKKIHNDKSSIIFKGDFFDQMQFDRLAEFSEVVSCCTVTRFDQYYQDELRIVEISEVLNQFKKGNCKGFKARRYIESESSKGKTGETLELGRRGKEGSGKFLRIYDKEAESEGKTKGIRWEVEWSGKRAESAWHIWTKAEFAAPTCAGMIFTTVDFIEPTHDSNRGRWKRLEWYQRLLESIEAVIVPVVVKKTNIEKKDKWLSDSVSGTIAYVRTFHHFTGRADSFASQMDTYIKTGREKISRSILLQLQKDIEKYMPENDPFGPPDLEQIRDFLRDCVE